MLVMLSSRARKNPFQCHTWEFAVVNTSRDETIRLKYPHDVYKGVFRGTLNDAVDDLLQYQIFPRHRMRSRVCTADNRIALDAVIIQRVMMGPIALETAVRVVEFDQSPTGARFAYATTIGHPEKGIASFEVRQRGDQIEFEVNAWSRSGTFLSMVGRPVSRYLQKYWTTEALSSFCSNSSRVDNERDAVT